MHKQQFPKRDRQKMMGDDPSNLAGNRTNNCQLSHQPQIRPAPMPDRNCDHTLNPTKIMHENQHTNKQKLFCHFFWANQLMEKESPPLRLYLETWFGCKPNHLYT